MTVSGLARMTLRRLLPVLCLEAAGLLGAHAAAQPPGASPPEAVRAGLRGLAYAREVCASCHAVEPGATAGPEAKARSFSAIATTPGMTPMALNVWFSTSHPTMPDLIISQRSKEDLYAYFEALRDASRAGSGAH